MLTRIPLTSVYLYSQAELTLDVLKLIITTFTNQKPAPGKGPKTVQGAVSKIVQLKISVDWEYVIGTTIEETSDRAVDNLMRQYYKRDKDPIDIPEAARPTASPPTPSPGPTTPAIVAHAQPGVDPTAPMDVDNDNGNIQIFSAHPKFDESTLDSKKLEVPKPIIDEVMEDAKESHGSRAVEFTNGSNLAANKPADNGLDVEKSSSNNQKSKEHTSGDEFVSTSAFEPFWIALDHDDNDMNWEIRVLVKDCTHDSTSLFVKFAPGIRVPLNLYGPNGSNRCLYAKATDLISELVRSENTPSAPWDLYWCLAGFPWVIGPLACRHHDEEEVQLDQSHSGLRDIPVTGSENALRIMVVFKHPNDMNCGVPGLEEAGENPLFVNNIRAYAGVDAIKTEPDVKPKKYKASKANKASDATQKKNSDLEDFLIKVLVPSRDVLADIREATESGEANNGVSIARTWKWIQEVNDLVVNVKSVENPTAPKGIRGKTVFKANWVPVVLHGTNWINACCKAHAYIKDRVNEEDIGKFLLDDVTIMGVEKLHETISDMAWVPRIKWSADVYKPSQHEQKSRLYALINSRPIESKSKSHTLPEREFATRIECAAACRRRREGLVHPRSTICHRRQHAPANAQDGHGRMKGIRASQTCSTTTESKRRGRDCHGRHTVGARESSQGPRQKRRQPRHAAPARSRRFSPSLAIRASRPGHTRTGPTPQNLRDVQPPSRHTNQMASLRLHTNERSKRTTGTLTHPVAHARLGIKHRNAPAALVRVGGKKARQEILSTWRISPPRRIRVRGTAAGTENGEFARRKLSVLFLSTTTSIPSRSPPVAAVNTTCHRCSPPTIVVASAQSAAAALLVHHCRRCNAGFVIVLRPRRSPKLDFQNALTRLDSAQERKPFASVAFAHGTHSLLSTSKCGFAWSNIAPGTSILRGGISLHAERTSGAQPPEPNAESSHVNVANSRALSLTTTTTTPARCFPPPLPPTALARRWNPLLRLRRKPPHHRPAAFDCPSTRNAHLGHSHRNGARRVCTNSSPPPPPAPLPTAVTPTALAHCPRSPLRGRRKPSLLPFQSTADPLPPPPDPPLRRGRTPTAGVSCAGGTYSPSSLARWTRSDRSNGLREPRMDVTGVGLRGDIERFRTPAATERGEFARGKLSMVFLLPPPSPRSPLPPLPPTHPPLSLAAGTRCCGVGRKPHRRRFNSPPTCRPAASSSQALEQDRSRDIPSAWRSRGNGMRRVCTWQTLRALFSYHHLPSRSPLPPLPPTALARRFVAATTPLVAAAVSFHHPARRCRWNPLLRRRSQAPTALAHCFDVRPPLACAPNEELTWRAFPPRRNRGFPWSDPAPGTSILRGGKALHAERNTSYHDHPHRTPTAPVPVISAQSALAALPIASHRCRRSNGAPPRRRLPPPMPN
ncbi:hypothetical protein C8R43DRAFT_1117777 [Mycena crocata]|nr:hypothetical protein C8R43DRAFT_1117777 [Mycena crocata]